MNGVRARPATTLLTERAHDFLAAGPADAVALVAHVCQMPGAPHAVAEQMATALFAEREEFARDAGGRWYLTTVPTADRLDALTYAVIDVETTGSRALAGDRITEVAVVLVERGRVVD
ncbi:MAG: hypothetical protein ACREON_11615, partial [Gemmatimonadaceae bacterium]